MLLCISVVVVWWCCVVLSVVVAYCVSVVVILSRGFLCKSIILLNSEGNEKENALIRLIKTN